MRDDQTFEEFMERVDAYEFRSKPDAAPLLLFYKHVLDEADRRGGTLPIEALAHLTGTGTTAGAFAAVVDWLGSHGLPMNHERSELYLHPVGYDFLDGFRTFGSCPDRWVELAAQFGVELPEAGDE